MKERVCNQVLADILRKHRVRTKLTQARLAFALDFNEATIRTYEHGKQTPFTTTLILMAEALSLEPSALLK